jgi:hypothetical protein
MAAVKVPTMGIVGTLDHTLKDMQELKTIRPGMKLVLLLHYIKHIIHL